MQRGHANPRLSRNKPCSRFSITWRQKKNKGGLSQPRWAVESGTNCRSQGNLNIMGKRQIPAFALPVRYFHLLWQEWNHFIHTHTFLKTGICKSYGAVLMNNTRTGVLITNCRVQSILWLQSVASSIWITQSLSEKASIFLFSPSLHSSLWNEDKNTNNWTS